MKNIDISLKNLHKYDIWVRKVFLQSHSQKKFIVERENFSSNGFQWKSYSN